MAYPDDIENRPADPFVRGRVGGSTGRTVTLSGLLGDSDRPGCRRLYLTTAIMLLSFRLQHRNLKQTPAWMSRFWTHSQILMCSSSL